MFHKLVIKIICGKDTKYNSNLYPNMFHFTIKTTTFAINKVFDESK